MLRSQVGGKWLDLAAVVGHPSISMGWLWWRISVGLGLSVNSILNYIHMHLFALYSRAFFSTLLNCGVPKKIMLLMLITPTDAEVLPSVWMKYDGTKSQKRKCSMMSYVLKQTKLIYTFFGMIILLVFFHLTHKKHRMFISCRPFFEGSGHGCCEHIEVSRGCLQPRVQGDHAFGMRFSTKLYPPNEMVPFHLYIATYCNLFVDEIDGTKEQCVF